MNLQTIIKERARISASIDERKSAHAKFLADAQKRLDQLSDAERLLLGGIDVERWDRGLAIVSVHGSVLKTVHGEYRDQDRSGSRAKLVADAKLDIANGAHGLRCEYFGVKNYSHFGDQREDHSYGMGPKHGSIVFRVGLQNDVRKRLNDGGALTPDEIEDALYVLSTLDKAEELRAIA